MNNFLTQDVNDPTDFEDAKLSKLDASLRCPVCKDFLDGPVNLNCGHSFCSQCIRGSLRTKPECPCCRSQALESHLKKNLALEESVLSWKAARPVVLAAMTRSPEPSLDSDRPNKKRKLNHSPPGSGSSKLSPSVSRGNGNADAPIELASSPPAHEASPGPDDLVSCPACDKRVPLKRMNEHLDRGCKDAPAARLEPGEGLGNFFKAKSGSTGGSTSKSKAKAREPIAKFSYDAMKASQVKAALARYELPQTGGKDALAARLQHWVEIYNANLDRRDALQHSDSSLRAELRRWEEAQMQLHAKGKAELPQDAKAYEEAHKSDFAKLVQQARNNAKKVQAQCEKAEPTAPHSESPTPALRLPEDDVILVD